MNNVIDEHIQNQLPIYLLHLEDMKLLRRPAIKGILQSAATDFIQGCLSEAKRHEWRTKSVGEVRSHAKEWITEHTPYAIFSHRWLDKGELNFQDVFGFEKLGTDGFRSLMDGISLHKPQTSAQILGSVSDFISGADAEGRSLGLLGVMKEFCDKMSPILRDSCADLVKVVEFCHIASQYGCQFVWFDTGCIDKSRSAELEESIRSMFNWYRNSKICIVHLADTTSLDTLQRDPWFTRGWTLQELLAPKRVLFFGKSWRRITPKRTAMNENDKVPDDVLKVPLWKRISKITGIPIHALLDFTPGVKHAMDTLVWVSKRRTTRTEDIAYCLVGLLDIPLSIAYGEGNAAFYRLQVEILQRSDDMGLFAWQGQSAVQNSMLAASADCFSPHSFRTSSTSEKEGFDSDSEDDSIDQTYSMTNRGLRIWLPGHSARILNESRAVDKSGVLEFSLEVEGMGTFKVKTRDIAQYKRIEMAVLRSVLDGRESSYLAILLGRTQGQWSRIVTEEGIRLPAGVPAKEPKLWFIK